MTVQCELRDGDPGLVPVVWFHGFLGSPAMWLPVTAAMTRVPRSAYAVLPGHGPYPWRPAVDSFDGAMESLAAALPFDRAILVGYSMGARLALALTLAYPERVVGAVLLGADPGLDDDAAVGARRAWDDGHAEALEAEGLNDFVTYWERLPVFATQQALPEELRAARRSQRLNHQVTGLAWALRTLGTGRMPSQWPAMKHATTPLLFVAGALDTKFAALADRAARLTPGSDVRLIEGAGHDAALEAPEALARIIESFVTTR